MPNYVTNVFAVKGNKKDVLAFINRGIENSAEVINKYGEGHVPETSDDLKAALQTLIDNGQTAVSNFTYGDKKNPEGNNPSACKRISLSTFRPIPDTFLRYDTTNNSELYKEAAKEQKEKYDVVGWYDYGITFNSPKWDSELTELNIVEDGDDAILYMHCSTAWSIPEGWLAYLKDEFPELHICYCSTEESGMFYVYGETGEDEYDMADYFNTDDIKRDDYESEDDYWDALSEAEDEAIERMQNDFYGFVEEL